MKVDHLKDDLLDIWVLRAENGMSFKWPERADDDGTMYYYNPIRTDSAAWAFIGPIVDRDGLCIIMRESSWAAKLPDWICGEPHKEKWIKKALGVGDNALEAVKRAIVWRKFGPTVNA